MIKLPQLVRNTGLIAATVATAAGLNFGVMGLAPAARESAPPDTAGAGQASPEAGALDATALDVTAPDTTAAPGVIATVAPDTVTVGPQTTAPGEVVTAAALTLPPGSRISTAAPSSSIAPHPSAPATIDSAPSTGTTPAVAASLRTDSPPATAAAPSSPAPDRPAPAATQPPSTRAAPTGPPSSGTASTQPASPQPTSTQSPSTAAPVTSASYRHTVDGVASVVVTVINGDRLELTSATLETGWSHTVRTDRPGQITVTFTPSRGDEVQLRVTVRDTRPVFSEERGDD